MFFYVHLEFKSNLKNTLRIPKFQLFYSWEPDTPYYLRLDGYTMDGLQGRESRSKLRSIHAITRDYINTIRNILHIGAFNFNILQ